MPQIDRSNRARFATLAVILLWLPLPAEAASLLKADIAREGESEALALTLDRVTAYRVLRVPEPDRLVIDLTDTELTSPVRLPANYNGRFIKNIRAARFDAHTLRIVFDLTQPVTVKDQGWLEAKNAKQPRLALLLSRPGTTAAAAAVSPVLPFETLPPGGNGSSRVNAPPARAVPLKDTLFKTPPVPKMRPDKLSGSKPLLIAIDAGHGGQDPGALGPAGSYEKDLTYAIALTVKRELLKTGRYKIFMTRGDDTFVLLRDRVERARKAKADLFISIHADSAPADNARGLSVYTLSETASDKEAAALAAKENRVDILSGLDLDVDNKEVADILIDLVRRDTRYQSSELADTVVESMKDSGVRLLPRPHRYAGFAVLKAPEIPSILIETGFISNAQEERLLNTIPYRDRLARAIVQALDRYQAARIKNNS